MSRSSVHKVTKYGTRWEQSHEPVRRSELSLSHPAQMLNKLKWERVMNAQGIEEEVILVPADRPRVVLWSETTTEMQEHKLAGGMQLRQAQGPEHFAALQQDLARVRVLVARRTTSAVCTPWTYLPAPGLSPQG